jgi:hypothetical protein
MLHEDGAFERSQDDNLWSRSRLIKCAKDTGHYPRHVMPTDSRSEFNNIDVIFFILTGAPNFPHKINDLIFRNHLTSTDS